MSILKRIRWRPRPEDLPLSDHLRRDVGLPPFCLPMHLWPHRQDITLR